MDVSKSVWLISHAVHKVDKKNTTANDEDYVSTLHCD